MELVQLNEVYTVTDTSEKGWKTQGQVIKEAESDIKINFYSDQEEKYVGSCNYNYAGLIDNKVHINIVCEKGLEDEYTDYCKNLVQQILESVK